MDYYLRCPTGLNVYCLHKGQNFTLFALGYSDILVLSLKDVLPRAVTVSTNFSAVHGANYNVIVFGM